MKVWRGAHNKRTCLGLAMQPIDLSKMLAGLPLILSAELTGLPHDLLIHFITDEQAMRRAIQPLGGKVDGTERETERGDPGGLSDPPMSQR